MKKSIFEIPLKTIYGEKITLNSFLGKVLLIVNVASLCGFTKQYKSLECLYNKYYNEGFEILGFPTNDFMEQEPGSDKDILHFCKTKFHITFPIFSKIEVNEKSCHPIYKILIKRQPHCLFPKNSKFKKSLTNLKKFQKRENIWWNFEKFLVGRSGSIIARFSPDIIPESKEIIDLIKIELKKNR